MARNWPSSISKRAMVAVVDAIGSALTAPRRFLRAPAKNATIRRILVIEPWRIGDVVLVTPLLAELRLRFPDASVTLLAKPHARAILDGSGLVDEIVEAELPWTRDRGKYRIGSGEFGAMRQLIRRLRAAHYDLALDARGDPRAHFLAALTGAKHTIGYDLAGGWLLTDPLPANPDERHKVGDWLNLLSALGGEPPAMRPPQLRADPDRVLRARETLERNGASRHPVIGIHPGASHAGKRWPLHNFAALSRGLREKLGGSTVVFIEPGGYGRDAEWSEGAYFAQVGIADLMAYLRCCDLFVCNDSGPMHLADALGVPLVALFERGNPQWFGPSGKMTRVVMGALAGKGTSPQPVNEPPRNAIEQSRVVDAVTELARELGINVPARGK